MIVFWTGVIALIAVSLVFLIAPLVRKRRVAAPPRTEYDVAVFSEQLREVEKDIDRGLLDDTQAESARTEIKRRLLAAAGEDKEEIAHKPGGAVTSNLGLVLLLAIVIPAGALGMYRYVGSPGVADMPLATRTDPALQEAKKRTEITRLVSQLEQKLDANPNNIEGWELLANAYESMERYADSAQALNRIVQLTDRDPEALSAYGEGLTMANKFAVTPVAKAVFEEAYKKDPTDARAPYYLGLAAAQEGDNRKAIDIWTALAQRSTPDAPWMGVLNQQMARAAEKLGIAAPKVAAPVTAPGPTRADMEAAGKMTEDDRGDMIRSMVKRLADRLAENPNDREGWQRLARAYKVLGENDKAIEAQAKADALAK